MQFSLTECLKLAAPILLIAWSQATAAPAVSREILRIGLAAGPAGVEIRALDRQSVRPHIAPASSIEKLSAIYFSLECFANTDCMVLKAPYELDLEQLGPEELVPALKEEGERLLGPFAELIQAADQIQFHVDWPLLKLPLDLLYLHGRPLFVSKKVSYAVGTPRNDPWSAPNPNWVGLLVSDRTADPDRAVLGIGKAFPKSQSFDIGDFVLSRLQTLEPVDFVVISGHGFVDAGGDGYISIGGDEMLRPGALTNLRPKLVYLDSCNLGISGYHLSELQEAGTIYVVAPILSNEAGDSSTATIEVFFSEFAQGEDPIVSLFSARKKLYERYANDDIRTMLWRAYPFRVYQLN